MRLEATTKKGYEVTLELECSVVSGEVEIEEAYFIATKKGQEVLIECPEGFISELDLTYDELEKAYIEECRA